MSSSNYTTKVCTKCGKTYPAASEYWVNSEDINSFCVLCEWKRQKEARKSSSSKAPKQADIANEPRYRTPINNDAGFDVLDAILECASNTDATLNPDYGLSVDEYNSKKRDKIRKYHKENPTAYIKHKLNMRCHTHLRRARELNADGTHTAADIRLQVTAQTDRRGRLRCWWCGKVIKGNNYHVDHRIPLVRGGSNAPNNLCVSCPVCNMSKHDKLPHEFNGRLL